jgi:hypothetical protein
MTMCSKKFFIDQLTILETEKYVKEKIYDLITIIILFFFFREKWWYATKIIVQGSFFGKKELF